MRISLCFRIFLEAKFIRIVAFMLFPKNIWQKPCVSRQGPILTRSMGDMAFQQTEVSDGEEERRCCIKPYLILHKYISC